MSETETQSREIQREKSFRHQSTPMPLCPMKGLKEGCFTTPPVGRCATATKQPRKLDLTDNFLNGTLSALAGKLRELEELRLDANQVMEIAPRAAMDCCHQHEMDGMRLAVYRPGVEIKARNALSLDANSNKVYPGE